MERARLGISVRDALKLEAFDGVEVVAGAGGLDSLIFHINVMEVPDILDWVREGELLFTTLYSLRDKPQEQVELIPRLAEKKLAGLAIKPKRYIDEIPSEALELADKHSFPILQLPPKTAFAALMEPLLQEILDFQTDLLHRSELAHNALLDVVLRGGSLEDLARQLSQLVNCQIVVLNRDFQSLTEEPPDLHQWLEHNRPRKDYRRLNKFNGQCPGILVPLMAGGSRLGFILAMAKSGDFSVLDEITLERGGTVAALEMMNARTVQEVERRYRNEFLVELVEGAFSDDVARQRASINGWHLQDEMRVFMYRFEDFRNQSQKDKLLQFLQENFCKRCISGELGRDVLVVTPVDHDLAEFSSRNIEAMERAAQSRLVIGVGRDSTSIRDIKYSFRQARGAVKTAMIVRGLGTVVHYNQLGVYRLLEEMRGKPELQAYIQDNLQVLLDYDKENNTELVKTLQRYYEFGGNLKQVARELFVHYNTVVYRVERIEKLLNVSLSNPRQRLSLEVAVRALEMTRDKR
ncbi:MAG: hypothetical protein FH749_04050 [Firmicutes bacterium]|nr:hypothetical protein [Bacillota bacterium]